MDNSIRKIPDDHLRALPTSPRQSEEPNDFYLEGEEDETESSEEDESTTPTEDRPVAPRLDGEAGGQVDLTA